MNAAPFTRPPDAFFTAIGSEVFEGLTSRPKTLAPWLFYDSEGSRLFEAITELPEYYLTRTEREILAENADEIIALAAVGKELSILELGAGTATKTGLLLQAAMRRQGGVTYRAIDVSESALMEAKTRLEADIAGVTVEPEVADYTNGLGRTSPRRTGERHLVMYIGSSIGNFSPEHALELLCSVRTHIALGDCLLLGVDMAKDRALLIPAYDDAAQVTARFNKNLLVRINRELDGNFDPELFRHRAIWNARQSRIEMHLESIRAQLVRIAALDLEVRFAIGETIHTENSYKFTNAAVVSMFERTGFEMLHRWSDARDWFGVYLAAAR
jgi:L-histidine Nalpha-methyltransferase